MAERQVKAVPENFSAGSEEALRAALAAEQAYVTRLYDRLDTECAQAERALREAPKSGGGSVLQARVERAVVSDEARRRLERLSGVESGLCFGRIDHRAEADGTDGDTFYIGRVGLRDDDREPLLIDWRAAAARPFYTATPSTPGSIARRRHLHLRGREVARLDDEVFDLAAMREDDRRSIVGEAALLATLRRGRTGRMTDVVATIQQEQDQVIRSGLHGVLVVQGGPGTGKTVAALHRVAYLLYTYRDVLERRGVLVVGPNATFMRYIDQVLPGLGETDVVLATVGELYPGVRATPAESPEVAVVKGDLRMAELVAAAVRDHQRAPAGGLAVEVDGIRLGVSEAALVKARDAARAVRAPHNVQRRAFVHAVLKELAEDRAAHYDRMTDEPLQEILASGRVPDWLQELVDEAEDEGPLVLDETGLRLAKEELWYEASVREAIDALWPGLTPERLLTELFADREALVACGAKAGLTPAEVDCLRREAGSPWTVADVPLLDEAAELLGVDDSGERAAARRAAEREREAEELYAQEVIISSGADPDVVDADMLAELNRAEGPVLTTAQRAAGDREWAYGHVVVDEAQELSAMAWRMIMRRVPTRSLTVVGDTAQTGSPAGARSWGQMLDHYVPGRWREQRLMINYRTPAAIMKVAERLLAEVAPEEVPPAPVRDDGPAPLAVEMPLQSGAREELAALVEAETAEVQTGTEGRVAVITSLACRGMVRAALPDAVAHVGPESLDAPVVVLTAEESKGLEFDSVIVVDPAGILHEGPRGGHDLYVAVTRPTRRLTLVHHGDLPAVLGAAVRR